MMTRLLRFYIGTTVLLGFAACQSEPGFSVTRMPLGATSSPEASVTSLPASTSPTASLTPILPTATITPAVTPTFQQQSSILLSEDFSQEQTCMESFENERARGQVEDGLYAIEVYAADEIINAKCETLVVGDFSLEADVTVEAFTPGGSYYFGLLFRVAGEERYASVIGNEGAYCVYYASDQNFVPLTNSTDFPVQCWATIPESAFTEGVQHLRVVAVDERMDLYLNGDLLAVVHDGKLREGWVGFVVATAGVGGVRVTFDNLVVARP